jgi:hypothetical protein
LYLYIKYSVQYLLPYLLTFLLTALAYLRGRTVLTYLITVLTHLLKFLLGYTILSFPRYLLSLRVRGKVIFAALFTAKFSWWMGCRCSRRRTPTGSTCEWSRSSPFQMASPMWVAGAGHRLMDRPSGKDPRGWSNRQLDQLSGEEPNVGGWCRLQSDGPALR